MASVSVNLKRKWFGPDGSAHDPADNPHTFPAAWAEPVARGEEETEEAFAKRLKSQKYAVLPTTAVVLEEPEPEPEPKKAPATKK